MTAPTRTTNRLRSVCAILVLCVAEFTPNIYAGQVDHLIPLDRTVAADWLKVMQSKLYLTSAEYGRILSFSSNPNDGERSIAVYANPKSQTGCSVTYAKAASNLGDAIWEFSTHRRDPYNISVKRIDASIPKPTALAIRGGLQKMLEQTHPLSQSELAGNEMILHGTTILISTEANNGQPKVGVLPPEADGAKAALVRKLITSMVQYCTQRNDARTNLAKQIEADATKVAQ